MDANEASEFHRAAGLVAYQHDKLVSRQKDYMVCNFEVVSPSDQIHTHPMNLGRTFEALTPNHHTTFPRKARAQGDNLDQLYPQTSYSHRTPSYSPPAFGDHVYTVASDMYRSSQSAAELEYLAQQWVWNVSAVELGRLEILVLTQDRELDL